MLQGYKARNAFIATQCPMTNTVNDFWRMIWEFKSSAIVMLCSEEHDKKVKLKAACVYLSVCMCVCVCCTEYKYPIFW